MPKMTATWEKGFRFRNVSATGHEVVTDAPEAVGGTNTGPTPMELIILGLIGCTGVDVASILERMRQPLEGLEVTAEYERAEDHPKVYTKIHLVYTVKGDIPAEKVERAVMLSEENFCSVSAMLRSTAEITSEIVQIP